VDGAVPAERVTLVPPGDASALRAAIEQLPSDPEVVPGALAWPTWADVAAEVEDVYARIVRRRVG
jgi:hypothetical protein